jgi:hypothetical protein
MDGRPSIDKASGSSTTGKISRMLKMCSCYIFAFHHSLDCGPAPKTPLYGGFPIGCRGATGTVVGILYGWFGRQNVPSVSIGCRSAALVGCRPSSAAFTRLSRPASICVSTNLQLARIEADYILHGSRGMSLHR